MILVYYKLLLYYYTFMKARDELALDELAESKK